MGNVRRDAGKLILARSGTFGQPQSLRKPAAVPLQKLVTGCGFNNFFTSRHHASHFTFHISRIMFHLSRFTFHASHLTFHISRFTFHVSPFTFHVSPFTFHVPRIISRASSDAYSNHGPLYGSRRSSRRPDEGTGHAV